MKQIFHKLTAAALIVSLCIPATYIRPSAAESTDGVLFTEPEKVSVDGSLSNSRNSLFNEGWKFYLGDPGTAQNVDFNDNAWKNISIPHDFSISQNFTETGEAESGFLPGGTGWYRKKFTLPEEQKSKSIVLNFDGVYNDAYVYVNGTMVGEHHYGYSPFSFDIGSLLVCDDVTENVIAVKVVNQTPSSRWYSGSGIFRDVTLICTDPIHVDVDGTAVTTPDIQNGAGTVRVKTAIQNSGGTPATVTVTNTVYDANQEIVSNPVVQTLTINANTAASVDTQSRLTVSQPNIWSLEHPTLYCVRTELSVDGQIVDQYDTEFGFRWYTFDSSAGFRLNGENLKLNGVCMHHDQGALGSAAHYDAMYRQISILKDMGVNAIRITHNPSSQTFIDICDELGILVIEEFFDGWNVAKNGNRYDFSRYFMQTISSQNGLIGKEPSMTWAEFALKSTVRRDRNHPSLILWSLGNEIQEGASTNPQFPTIARSLIQWTREEDASRLVTNGDNTKGGNSTLVQVASEINKTENGEKVGISGFNYASSGELASLAREYGCILSSETASAVNSRGIYSSTASQGNADGKYHLTSYDTSAVSWGKTAHASMWDTMQYDNVAGQFVWTGFDYIGEPTPWNGTDPGSKTGKGPIPNSSYFGIIETTGFPKDSYYLYRSQWNQKSYTLHLVTSWDDKNRINNNGMTPVVIYSNAPRVDLYRDNLKIGTAVRTRNTTKAGYTYYTYTASSDNASICTAINASGSESLYASFSVAFASGTISARAYDGNTEITDQCAGTNSISTPGAASLISISADKKEICANGTTLSYITADVTDSHGNPVTTAGNDIRFTLTGEGEIIGVDNGDQATVDKYQQASVLTGSTSAHIKAYAGKALVIVRSTKTAGSFTLKAESTGLTPASVTITTTQSKEDLPEENKISEYTMRKHCYIKTGCGDISGLLPKTADVSYTKDPNEKELAIDWDDYDVSLSEQKGIFRIYGSITDPDLNQTIGVFLTVHVYADIVAAQNHSLYTGADTLPTLPATAMTYDTDGDAFEEFPIVWEDISDKSFDSLETIVPVHGTVQALGNNYSTTAFVRVATPDITRQNVARDHDHLTDNGPYNDTLDAVTDGILVDDGTSDSRWSDWDKKHSSDPSGDIIIAMDWATATLTDQIDLYYFYQPKNDEASVLPDTVKFEYALSSNYSNGEITANQWLEIGYSTPTDIPVENDTHGWTVGKRYSLNQTINPQAIRITFTHPAKTFIGLNEIEVLKPSFSYEPKTSATLDGVTIGKEFIPFSDSKDEYDLSADSFQISDVSFENPENAAVTLLQLSSRRIKIICVSEDKNATAIYYLNKVTTKEELLEKLEEYQNLNSIYYTQESFQTLQNLIAEILPIVDSLSDAALLEKLNALKDAFRALDPNPDAPTEQTRQILLEKLETYKALDASLYTPESFERLQNLIRDILSRIDTLTESGLLEQTAALEDAFQKLDSIENPDPDAPTKETKETLRKKINEYKNLDASLYTEETFQFLQNLIAQIEAQIDTLTESGLLKKLSELEDAFQKLDSVEKPNPDTPLKDALKSKLDEYRKLDASLYTAESFLVLKNLMDETEPLLDSLTEQQCKEKLEELKQAFDHLVPYNPNESTEEIKASLKETLAEGKAINSSLYTTESYEKLSALIQEIESQMDTLSKEELEQKLNALKEAIKNLKPVSSVPKPPLPPADQTPPDSSSKEDDSCVYKNVHYQIQSEAKQTAIAVKPVNKKASKITIADTVTIRQKRYKVTAISANAFISSGKFLKSVVIGKNVKTVGKNAFLGCKKMNKITWKGAAQKPCKKNAFKGTRAKIKVVASKKIAKAKRKAFAKNLSKTGGMKKPSITYK